MTARNGVWIACLLALAAIGCEGSGSAAAKDARGQLPAAEQQAAPPTAAAAACGGKDEPDCPLQIWMKATLQTYQREGDYERLARAMDDLAAHAPAGYGNWVELSKQGAEAARRSDAAGVRTACKSCHDEHRAQYRRELRASKWM